MDQLSYAWGIAIGKQLRGMGLTDLRYDDFDRALKASFEDLPTEMEAQEAQKIITEYLEELSRKAAEAAQSVGKKFLEENGKKRTSSQRPPASSMRWRKRAPAHSLQPRTR